MYNAELHFYIRPSEIMNAVCVPIELPHFFIQLNKCFAVFFLGAVGHWMATGKVKQSCSVWVSKDLIEYTWKPHCTGRAYLTKPFPHKPAFTFQWIYINCMHITWILQLTYVRHGVRLAKITLVFLQSMFYCIKEGRVCNDPIKWNNHNRHLPIIDHLKRFTNINSTARIKDRSTGNIL